MLTVYDYLTGHALDGEPSTTLTEQSHAEPAGTGAVLAYRDDSGIWQWIPDADESLYRDHLHRTVRTVWVDEE